MVALHRDVRRVVSELSLPGIAGIHILGRTIAVKFPDPGNGNAVPARHVGFRFPESHRAAVRIRHPVE